MADQAQTDGTVDEPGFGRRAGDNGFWSMLFRNGRRGAAVFWILLWFTVAIVTALSSLVSTQFKETFRSSGISLTELTAETRRQDEEKKVADRLQKLSDDIERARIVRDKAVSEKRQSAYLFDRQGDELWKLEDIAPESRTAAQEARIGYLRSQINDSRPVVLKLESVAHAAEGAYSDLKEQYADLIARSETDLKPPSNLAVTVFARDSLYLQNDFFLMRWFFDMPSDLVTLWLALCMGALGSVIYVLREIFDDTAVRRPTSWFFMRPFLGMVLAFVMYLLIRTGQTAFTDPAGGPSSLNPFTISFLAVISGLMSDRAYSRIVSAAENLLGPDERKPAKPDDDPDPGSSDGDASSTPSPPPAVASRTTKPARRRQK